ncbi:MAG: hypothetical protein K2I96_04950 [Lachnospiraceae bacterium]|nr:hypothetical protein [Lachnospiraceae bacterium]
MTRGFELEDTKRNRTFALRVRNRIDEYQVSRDKIMKLTGIKQATLSRRFFSKTAPPEPDMMTIKELRVYCKLLKLSDEDILNFVRG